MPPETCTFADDGVTLAYEVHGRGDRTLVYLHGLLFDRHVNRRLAADLAAAGNRVVLLDLPGRTDTGRPGPARAYRVDAYARQVVRLLDELGAPRAVVGGVSLGACVSLHAAMLAPDRLEGLVLEMPVLEPAPVARWAIAPALALGSLLAPAWRAAGAATRLVPRRWAGPFGPLLAPVLSDPEELSSVVRGVLAGPLSPTAQERASIVQPALVIGHRGDQVHPFTDARLLAEQLPGGRLVQALSPLELRTVPWRLTTAIARFLDEVWETRDQAGHRDRASHRDQPEQAVIAEGATSGVRPSDVKPSAPTESGAPQ